MVQHGYVRKNLQEAYMVDFTLMLNVVSAVNDVGFY